MFSTAISFNKKGMRLKIITIHIYENILVVIQFEGQTAFDRQTDRRKDRQTNRQTDRQTDRQTNRQTNRQT